MRIRQTLAARLLGIDPTEVARLRQTIKDTHTALDSMRNTAAPDLITPADRIRHAARLFADEAREASHLATLCQSAHDALDRAGLRAATVDGRGTPADRIAILLSYCESVEHQRDQLRRELTAPERKARAVPEGRRDAILRAVGSTIARTGESAVTAQDVGSFAYGNHPALAGLSASSIARTVSTLAAEGWLVADGKKPARYSLTGVGRGVLASSLAKTLPKGEELTNCWTCGNLREEGGTVRCQAGPAAYAWREDNKPLGQMPHRSATGCPGHTPAVGGGVE